jgi:hypothetical protein
MRVVYYDLTKHRHTESERLAIRLGGVLGE